MLKLQLTTGAGNTPDPGRLRAFFITISGCETLTPTEQQTYINFHLRNCKLHPLDPVTSEEETMKVLAIEYRKLFLKYLRDNDFLSQNLDCGMMYDCWLRSVLKEARIHPPVSGLDRGGADGGRRRDVLFTEASQVTSLLVEVTCL